MLREDERRHSPPTCFDRRGPSGFPHCDGDQPDGDRMAARLDLRTLDIAAAGGRRPASGVRVFDPAADV